MSRLTKIIVLLFVCTVSFSFGKEGTIDIDEIAKKEAAVEKKNIMVFFHMTHCPYCMKMINTAFSDESAKKKMDKDYIFIDLNVDDPGTIKYKDFKGSKKEFAKSLAIGFYPSIVFIDGNNEIIYALKGYKKTKTFNQTLDYITSKAYLTTDFAGYLFDIEE